MKQEELLRVLSSVAGGIAKAQGRDTEVVVHDLNKMEVVFIANGNITGREAGSKMDKSVYKTILEQADEDGHMIGYSSSIPTGKHLRSSHIIIKDEAGEPAALMCINEDNSKLEEIRDYLNYMIHVKNDEDDNITNNIQKIAQRAVMNAVRSLSTSEFETKEGKINLLKHLKKQGVFDVKATTPYICKVLSISQTTLYNYLREIKNEEGESGTIEIK